MTLTDDKNSGRSPKAKNLQAEKLPYDPADPRQMTLPLLPGSQTPDDVQSVRLLSGFASQSHNEEGEVA